MGRIGREKVKEAWGGNIAMPATYNYYGSSGSSSYQNSANAYMLMYRRINVNSEETVVMPKDEEVPEYVRDEMRQLEEQEEVKRKEQAERFNKLVIKVMFDDKERTINTSRSKTYVELLTQLWEELSVIDSPKLADLKEKHSSEWSHGELSSVNSIAPVPLDRIRLRQYNTYLKVPQDIHDVNTKGGSTLSALNILDYRTMYLQCRSVDEEWDEYLQNGVNLLALVYDPATDSFLPGKNIRMARNATVLELKVKLNPLVSYDLESMRVMKLTALGQAEIRKEELVDDAAELELKCRIYEGTKVFIENKTDASFDQSPSVKCFIKSINTITVNISSVGKTNFDIKLVVDRRSTFEAFRKRIAEEVNMEPDSFRIHRHVVKGQELQYAGHETLLMVGIYDGVSLALSSGVPLKPGYCTLGIVMYDAKCPGGIKNLTDMTLEEAVEAYPIPPMESIAKAGAPLDTIDEGTMATAESPTAGEVNNGTTDSLIDMSIDKSVCDGYEKHVNYEDSVVIADAAWSPQMKVTHMFLI